MSEADYVTGIDTMTKEVVERAQLVRKEIIGEAEAEGQKILEVAQNEVPRIKKSVIEAEKSKGAQEMRKEVSRKKLSAQMDFYNVRAGIIDGILAEVRTKLQGLTGEKSYTDFLEKTLVESVRAVGSGEYHIQVREEDMGVFTDAFISKAVKVAGVSGITIQLDKTPLTTLGGLKLVRKDGKLIVDNTFESSMSRYADDIQLAIMKALQE